MNRKLEIVRRIACEKSDSQLIPAEPRNAVQKVRLTKLYELLVVLRVILTLNLQTGWIHQDEFTNSLEVIAGDYCDLQVFKSSAFNTTFPTRSVAFLHLTLYVPYVLGNHFLTYFHPVGQELVPDARRLILIPRIAYLILSFFVDYLLLQFCSLQHRHTKKQVPQDPVEDINQNKDEPLPDNYHTRLLTLSSSQVMIVFATRTHAALINLILYAMILYLVSDSLYRMETYLPVLNKYHCTEGTRKGREKVLLLRELKALGYKPCQRLHWIAAIVVAGTFNDPEFFLSYACVPIFFYLQRGISNPHIGMTHFHARLFTFLAYFFAFSVPFVLWDSFYFGRVTFRDLYDLNLNVNSFVVTPVNYFATKVQSLPRDLSAFPRIMIAYFLLFNVLGLLGLTSFFKEVYDICFQEWRFKPRMDSQWTFLNCSWFLPLLVLIQYKSAFDLVPLIFPLVFMHGHKIPLVSRFSYKLGLIWFFCNLLGLFFWGYANQGGILTSFLDINKELTPIRFNDTRVDIVLAQMAAIPPTFVLVIPNKWKTVVKLADRDGLDDEVVKPEVSGYDRYIPSIPRTVLKLEHDSKVRVFHTGLSSRPFCQLESELGRLIQSKNRDDHSVKMNFIVLPTSYHKETLDPCFKTIKFKYVKTYWNHVNVDSLSQLFSGNSNNEISEKSYGDIGLNLYRLQEISPKANALSEDEFKKHFRFEDEHSSFESYTINVMLTFLTIFLFLMSFMTCVL